METRGAARLRVELHQRGVLPRPEVLRRQEARRVVEVALQPAGARGLEAQRKWAVVSEPAEVEAELLQASFVTVCPEP